MTFNIDDWQSRLEGLTEAQQLLAAYRADQSQRKLLDRAIWHIWRFAEYALNSGLELCGLRPDRGHELDKSGKILHANSLISADHSVILRQLEAYRRKVDYGSYSRDRSVHYNATNAEACLACILSLRDELVPHLQKARKLP